eukprot:6485327-Amphidinium_carterae.1
MGKQHTCARAEQLTGKDQPRHHRLLPQWHPVQGQLVPAREHGPVPLLTAAPSNLTHNTDSKSAKQS